MSRALRIEFPGAHYHAIARGVAGLALGSEAFVARVTGWLRGRTDTGEPPALLRAGKADPEDVEKAVAGLFSDFGPVQRRGILLYAQRHYSRLSPTAIT